MDTKIYTPKQAWEKLGIGRTRFYQLLKEGKIRYFKTGAAFSSQKVRLLSSSKNRQLCLLRQVKSNA